MTGAAKGLDHCFVEGITHLGSIAVAKAAPLNHQQQHQIPVRVNPRLCPPRSTVAECVGGQQSSHSLRMLHHAPSESPGVARRKAGFEIAGVGREHLPGGLLRQIQRAGATVEGIQDCSVEFQHVSCCGIQPAGGIGQATNCWIRNTHWLQTSGRIARLIGD